MEEKEREIFLQDLTSESHSSQLHMLLWHSCPRNSHTHIVTCLFQVLHNSEKIFWTAKITGESRWSLPIWCWVKGLASSRWLLVSPSLSFEALLLVVGGPVSSLFTLFLSFFPRLRYLLKLLCGFWRNTVLYYLDPRSSPSGVRLKLLFELPVSSKRKSPMLSTLSMNSIFSRFILFCTPRDLY